MKTADIMTCNVVSVRPETTILQAAQLMLQHRISGLPVVDSDGYVVGIVCALRNKRSPASVSEAANAGSVGEGLYQAKPFTLRGASQGCAVRPACPLPRRLPYCSATGATARGRGSGARFK
jgi:CBS-domain-containing membrane protein